MLNENVEKLCMYYVFGVAISNRIGRIGIKTEKYSGFFLWIFQKIYILFLHVCEVGDKDSRIWFLAYLSYG